MKVVWDKYEYSLFYDPLSISWILLERYAVPLRGSKKPWISTKYITKFLNWCELFQSVVKPKTCLTSNTRNVFIFWIVERCSSHQGFCYSNLLKLPGMRLTGYVLYYCISNLFFLIFVCGKICSSMGYRTMFNRIFPLFLELSISRTFLEEPKCTLEQFTTLRRNSLHQLDELTRKSK